MKNILILVAHPDDEIVGTCIFIKRKIQEGHKIFLLFLTNGVIDKNDMWFWEKKKYSFYLERRLAELRESVNLLRVTGFYIQNIPTRTLKDSVYESFSMIQKIIKKENIDYIFSPAYEGGHQDHDVANSIASKFKKSKKVFEFSEYHYFNNKISSNCFINFSGNEVFLNLSYEEIKFKKKLIKVYKSEIKNLNYINFHQECFRPIIDYDYSKPPHEGTLFYRRFSMFSWHPKVDSTLPDDVCSKIINTKIDFDEE